jgi:hypothetical protein
MTSSLMRVFMFALMLFSLQKRAAAFSLGIPPTARACENPNREVGDASVQPTRAATAILKILQPEGWGSFTVSLNHLETHRLERSPTFRLGDCGEPVPRFQ